MSSPKQRRVFDKIKSFATTVGAGSTITGDMTGKDDCVAHGVVNGNCDLDANLIISAGAKWNGDIHALNVLVAGQVEGNVTAMNQLEILASGSVTGRLVCPNIALAEGAVHRGEIRMSRETAITRFSERRQRDDTVEVL